MPTCIRTHTRVHTRIWFANPWLACDCCRRQVTGWHDRDRCGCEQPTQNLPCGHDAGATSLCWSWSPIDGCRCILDHRFGER